MDFRTKELYPFYGTSEQKINLSIVLKLQKLLEQSGCTVILTRTDENGIYEVDKYSIREKKVSDMKKRVYIGNNSQADIYISIHLNFFEQSKYSGWQTFYKSGNKESETLANMIQNEISNNIQKENDRVPMTIKGSYIMDKLSLPSVIVECGFLSNTNEEQLLKEDCYQNSITWGIYIGIQKYFSV